MLSVRDTAAWYVETWMYNGSVDAMPLVDFGTIAFQGAQVQIADGSTVHLDKAQVNEIQESGYNLTSVSKTSDSGVLIAFRGWAAGSS